jgi:hypothetical protein
VFVVNGDVGFPKAEVMQIPSNSMAMKLSVVEAFSGYDETEVSFELFAQTRRPSAPLEIVYVYMS